MKRLQMFYLGILLIISSFIYAGNVGKLAGKITDVNGKPIPYADIRIEGTELATKAKENGTYIILNIPHGIWNVTCRHNDFQTTKIIYLEIIRNLTTIQNFKLNMRTTKTDSISVLRYTNPYNQIYSDEYEKMLKTKQFTDASLYDSVCAKALQMGVTGDLFGQVIRQRRGMILTEENRTFPSVTIAIDGTQIRAKSNSLGYFLITNLAHGKYHLKCSSNNFQTLIITNLPINEAIPRIQYIQLNRMTTDIDSLQVLEYPFYPRFYGK